METMQILIHNIPRYNKGRVIRVETRQGVPRAKFWRDRLRDAKIDNCCSVYPAPTKKTSATKTAKEG